MNDTVYIIILAGIFIVVMMVLPQLLIKKAITTVIRIFRDNNAIGVKNAKTLDELGLQPKSMIENMFKPRDYKPRALKALMSADIIQMTEDGKVYLVEDKLAATNLR